MRMASSWGLGVAALDTAPEFALGGDNQMLIERIGMGDDLDPFAAAGNHRQHRAPCCHHPHIVLQLGHVFLGGSFLRERPRQHELGLEDGPGRFDPAVEGRRHPAQRRVAHLLLDVGDYLSVFGLIPASVQLLGCEPELDNKVARQVLRFNLAALFAPEAD
jgi:hypothetical protein